MARSTRLRELERRLNELRRHLLPAQFDPTGAYSARVIDRARSYRLLAHAEIEACVEDLVRDLVSKSYAAWELDKRPRTCLLALVSFYDDKFPRIPEAMPATLSRVTPGFMKDRIEIAKNSYGRAVQQNNGVKEKDLLRLLLPVGIQDYELDRTWLATIDSFGSVRGDTAHQSMRTQQPPDPANELAIVRQIVAGLRQLDELCAKLGAEQPRCIGDAATAPPPPSRCARGSCYHSRRHPWSASLRVGETAPSRPFPTLSAPVRELTAPQRAPHPTHLRSRATRSERQSPDYRGFCRAL
jgi:hypothetical protein